MKHEILYRPSYALLVVRLDDGESLRAESGAMVSMSSNVEMQTSMNSKQSGVGGFLKSLAKKALGGESFWVNTFTARGGAGEVSLATTLPGDIEAVDLSGDMTVQSGSYIASHPDIEVDAKWGGAKSFFGGEGLFMLKVKGHGPLYLSSYGGIECIEVKDRFILDTGHIVAFDDSLQYEVKKVGGWKSTFLSGEGLVAEFRGTGRLYLQTRNTPSFGQFLGAKLPPIKR